MQIDFRAALIGSITRAFSIKLCSVSIRGSVMCILTQFLRNQSQHVMVDGCRSKLVKSYARRAAGQCFGPGIVPSVHHGVFSILHSILNR